MANSGPRSNSCNLAHFFSLFRPTPPQCYILLFPSLHSIDTPKSIELEFLHSFKHHLNLHICSSKTTIVNCPSPMFLANYWGARASGLKPTALPFTSISSHISRFLSSFSKGTNSCYQMASSLDHLSSRTRFEWLSGLNTEFRPSKSYRRTGIICTIGRSIYPIIERNIF